MTVRHKERFCLVKLDMCYDGVCITCPVWLEDKLPLQQLLEQIWGIEK